MLTYKKRFGRGFKWHCQEKKHIRHLVGRQKCHILEQFLWRSKTDYPMWSINLVSLFTMIQYDKRSKNILAFLLGNICCVLYNPCFGCLLISICPKPGICRWNVISSDSFFFFFKDQERKTHQTNKKNLAKISPLF